MRSLIFNQKKHKGDCHLCRPFLKSIATSNPGWKFYRRHAIERTLHDVPMEYTKEVLPGIPVVEIWIGQQGKKFVDLRNHPAFPPSPNGYKVMFKEICEKYNLACNLSDYIPSIDYSLYEIHKIDNFLSAIQKPCVIVSNGEVLSGQTYNFSMDPVIETIKPFFTIVTTKDTEQDDVHYIGNIVNRDDEDLAELSYLSTKAYAFIGRSSGPYTFSMVKENFNGKLKMICLAIDENALYWKGAANSYWIHAGKRNMNDMLRKISLILGV